MMTLNNADRWEEGTNRIFDSHADEKIVPDESIPRSLSKQVRPDRVYGLRRTNRIKRLLTERRTPEGHRIGEIIRTHPFSDKCEELIYPFLVLEAKSEKSSYSLSDAEAQTACTIVTLLQLQIDLLQKAKNGSISHQDPLVWFLSHKGENWTVAICFVENLKPRRTHVS